MSDGVPAASKIAEVALVSVSADNVSMIPSAVPASARHGGMRLCVGVGCQLLTLAPVPTAVMRPSSHRFSIKVPGTVGLPHREPVRCGQGELREPDPACPDVHDVGV